MEPTVKNQDTKADYILTLYIIGASPNSARAVSNIRSICNEYMPHSHELKIIDVYQQPGIAQENQLVALPTLVKHYPLPIKKLVGNMGDVDKILTVLELEHKVKETGE